MGPQRHLAYSLRRARNRCRCPAAAAPSPSAARLGHQQEQPQLGHLVALPDAEDRPQPPPGRLGDPAALARRIVVAEEGREDLGHQRLEAHVIALVAGIERAMLADQPAGIAGLPGRAAPMPAPARSSSACDLLHRRGQRRLARRPASPPIIAADLGARPLLHRRERPPRPPRSAPAPRRRRVGRIGRRGEPALLPEPLQQPADR